MSQRKPEWAVHCDTEVTWFFSEIEAIAFAEQQIRNCREESKCHTANGTIWDGWEDEPVSSVAVLRVVHWPVLVNPDDHYLSHDYRLQARFSGEEPRTPDTAGRSDGRVSQREPEWLVYFDAKEVAHFFSEDGAVAFAELQRAYNRETIVRVIHRTSLEVKPQGAAPAGERMPHELAFCDLPGRTFDDLLERRWGYPSFDYAFWLATVGPARGGGVSWQSRCTFCGGFMVVKQMIWPRNQPKSDDQRAYVWTYTWMECCHHCGLHGPIGNTPEEATELYQSGRYPHSEAWSKRLPKGGAT